METSQHLDDQLARPMSDDAWADDGIDVAGEAIRHLRESEWQALARSWSDKPLEWGRRLAEVLYHADPARAVPILVEMLDSGHGEIVQAAVESLSAFASDGVDIRLTERGVDRLREFAATRSDFDAGSVVELLTRLRTPRGVEAS